VVIIVHHCGLDETRPRGHTSLPGAVDAQLAISREGMTVTAEVEFMRDGPEGTIVAGRGEIIPVGHDINGRELSSLVIEPIDGDGAPARQIRRKWGGALKVFHDSLTEALISSGVNYRIPEGPIVKAVDLEVVRKVFCARYIGGSVEATKEQQRDTRVKAFKRCVAGANQAPYRRLRR
jgi:hypothetical protein